MTRLGTRRGIVRVRTNRTIAFYGLVVEIKVCGIHPARMQKPAVKQNGPDDEQRRRHQAIFAQRIEKVKLVCFGAPLPSAPLLTYGKDSCWIVTLAP